MNASLGDTTRPPSLALAARQRSHVLLVLADALPGNTAQFERWLDQSVRQAVSSRAELLCARSYVEDDVDITRGRFTRLPFRYLTIFELSVDGADQCGDAIDMIARDYIESGLATAPATWLYHPASSKVGVLDGEASGMTVAYANACPGEEAEFREWYATRHIRHALHIPALVSGEFLERSLFQNPGAMENGFAGIALYEQSGSAQSIVDAFLSLPPETFSFPSMDKSRFSEASYRCLGLADEPVS
ncbi:hypothetical protein SAMIE_1002850 [Sphingobium amiense]|uniref:EthD domain-containing protein n=1 Tax=Sphingobium amiense TaxID=135719 RepID=A0A494VWK0_9SPHN|nr:hypothetical protein [Sphingobium amiense]BBD96784.1 hypothetical protein SAMIE_1002850 [Sphingobium amiense]